MCARWNQQNVPHKGWICIDVIDVREDGLPVAVTEYETCMMCGNERIRYVHILIHKEVEGAYRVGCICSEKMTEDYLTPRVREKELKNKSNRRVTWIKKSWKISKSGNQYLNTDGNNVSVFFDKKTGRYKCRINDTFGTKLYYDINTAKIGIFNKIEDLRHKGIWHVHPIT